MNTLANIQVSGSVSDLDSNSDLVSIFSPELSSFESCLFIVPGPKVSSYTLLTPKKKKINHILIKWTHRYSPIRFLEKFLFLQVGPAVGLITS